jgi:hypothetical protein
MAQRFWLAWLGCVVAATAAWAEETNNGPPVGDPPPALKVFDVTGGSAGLAVDYVAERKDKPTVYLFIAADKWDRPVGRFVKELDSAVVKDFPEAYLVAVWLTDDVDKSKEYLPRAQQSIKLERTALTCFEGEKSGPEGWNIADTAHLTAIVAVGGKVVKNFEYRSLNETDVPAVYRTLKQAAEKK